jgi:hypothetical protein
VSRRWGSATVHMSVSAASRCIKSSIRLSSCRRDGLPLDDRHLYKLFWTTALRLSGKRMNPHLVRCLSSSASVARARSHGIIAHQQPLHQSSTAVEM